MPGSVIVFLHLDRKLAAADFTGFSFNGLKQQTPDAVLAMSGQDGKIRNIDQRPGRESGKTNKAVGNADCVTSLIGQKDYGGGMFL